MSEGQELNIKTPAAEITARNEVEETSQNLLADSRTAAPRSGATEIFPATQVVTPGAKEYFVKVSANTPGAIEIPSGLREFVADTKPSDVNEAVLAKIEAKAAARKELKETIPVSHDLETLILGGALGWGLYRENKKELDPIIDVTEKVAFEVSTGSLPRLAENIVNKPLTTALEFVLCPALPFLHASVSAANDALKK